MKLFSKTSLARLIMLVAIERCLWLQSRSGERRGEGSGAASAIVPEVEWVAGQSPPGNVGIVQEGDTVTVTLETNYAYAMIRTLAFPERGSPGHDFSRQPGTGFGGTQFVEAAHDHPGNEGHQCGRWRRRCRWIG